ncbi:MAG: ATP-grasp domain-containing protein, partial [Gammaproteobacteria bacterium]
FCEQFCAVLPEHPFTYGGAVTLRPGDLPSSLPSELADACTALVAATGLRGLCGIDVIAADARWWLIDINPRPGATFALHERTASLLRLHIDAVRGHLPKVRVSVPTSHRGHAIVYAPRRIETRAWRWPAWVSDRPRPMLAINAGEPICTVHAQAAQPCEVSATLRARQNHILNLINMW